MTAGGEVKHKDTEIFVSHIYVFLQFLRKCTHEFCFFGKLVCEICPGSFYLEWNIFFYLEYFFCFLSIYMCIYIMFKYARAGVPG